MGGTIVMADSRNKSAPLVSSTLLCAFIAFFIVFLVWPLLTLVQKSLFEEQTFAGLKFFREFMETPGLYTAFFNTLLMGLAVTAATLVPAFMLAYALTHTCFAGRKQCRFLAMLPLFIPSFLPAIGLIYLFGAQGALSGMFGEIPLYGPLGIFLGCMVFALPHALLPLLAALGDIDGDLYLAARSMGAGPWRRFLTVTLPGSAYGLISAAIVIFVLTITDFGVPKVLGGSHAMLSTEIFKQVIGMQNFNLGAAVSLLLLLPCLPAFALDSWARKRKSLHLQGRAFRPETKPARDAVFTLFAWGAILLPTAVTGMVVWGSFISFWPYELGLTLSNYGFQNTTYGLAPFGNSLLLAAWTAALGTVVIFCGSYLAGRCNVPRFLASSYRLLAIIPLALPGTVLGLAYIFAFNVPALDSFYGTIPFLALNCVIHFYTVCHFTASGSLARLAPNYEVTGETLSASRLHTFAKVILPMQKNTIASIAFYLFVNALSTVSAVVFLYAPGNPPASVAILQMLDSGAISQASAMGTLLLLAALAASFLLGFVQKR